MTSLIVTAPRGDALPLTEVNMQVAHRAVLAMTTVATKIGVDYGAMALVALYTANQTYYREEPIAAHQRFWSGGYHRLVRAMPHPAPEDFFKITPNDAERNAVSGLSQAMLQIGAQVPCADYGEVIVAALWIAVNSLYENPPKSLAEAFTSGNLKRYLDGLDQV